LNFLDLLGANYTVCMVNDAALRYMRECALAGPMIARLATSSTPSPCELACNNDPLRGVFRFQS
jgi:hypothetical protein